MSAFQDWVEGDEAPWQTVNDNTDSLGQAWTYAERKAGHSGLNVGLGGGAYTEAITISDQAVACTDDDDTYIVANRSTGAVTASTGTTNWTDTGAYGRIAIVAFAAGVLTSYRDFRFGAGGIFRTDASGAGDVVGPASSVDGHLVQFDGTTGKLLKDGIALDTDGTLAANSNIRVPSQAAVKAYADALIAANDAMVFKGVIDCSANPNYPAASRGDTYRVSVAGKIGGGSGPNVEVGDLLLCLTDGTSAGTHGTVGSSWNISQTNLDGAVIGPASVTDGQLALFDGTSGKLIKAATMSGDGTLSSSGALTLANSGVTAGTYNKLTVDAKGRATAGVDTATVTALTISAGVVNIDCSLGDYFTLALNANVTSITFSNLPGSGKGATKWIEIVQDSTARTVAWPASFKWAGGSAGAVSTASGAVDELAITTVNNGTAWKASLGKAFA